MNRYRAELVEVINADTLKLRVFWELGDHTWDFQLANADACEDKDAKEHVQKLLEGKELYVTIHGRDMNRRFLVSVECYSGFDLGEKLVEDGYATEK